MKLKKENKYAKIAVYCCGIILFALIAGSVFTNFENAKAVVKKFFVVFSPVTYGFVIAFLVNPVMKFFENRVFKFWRTTKKSFKFKRVVTMICAFLVAASLISGFVAFLVPQIITSYKDLESKMSEYVLSAQKWVMETFGKDSRLPDFVVDFINVDKLVKNINSFIGDSYELIVDVTPYVFKFIGNIINELKNALIGIIFSVYFLYSKERLGATCKKIIYAIFDEPRSNGIMRVAKMTRENFEGFVVGKIIDSIIIGVLTFFVLMIFKMPYYPIIALIVGITNVIPFFGPFIGAIPSAFIIFIADPMKAIWFLLIILVIQQIDGNIIGPKVLGYSTDLSALGVMLAIIIMSGFFGVLGMVIGVPIFSVLNILFFEYVDKRLENKNKDIAVEAYFGSGNGDLPKKKEEECEPKEEEIKN
ncbi:MAG: AI-2E family transporter [Ruminococcaceae bacterium]|nr:AI-2E family transporter [Oscillospiraceae bacterium]